MTDPRTRVFPVDRGRAVDATIRAWVAAGRPAATPRTAATVLLVRDGSAGPEVFVQRRASTMAFAPSMIVFPGGRVDPADGDAGHDPAVVAALADRMGLPMSEAAPVVGAAVREVEEECGVRVPVDALSPRGRWLTPKLHPRRYDTWFFAARMPAGQVALGTTSETVDDRWGRPRDLLALEAAGELRLMPPTIHMLETLGSFATVDDYLADEPSLALVEPVVVETDDGYVLRSDLP